MIKKNVKFATHRKVHRFDNYLMVFDITYLLSFSVNYILCHSNDDFAEVRFSYFLLYWCTQSTISYPNRIQIRWITYIKCLNFFFFLNRIETIFICKKCTMFKWNLTIFAFCRSRILYKRVSKWHIIFNILMLIRFQKKIPRTG